MRIKTTLSYVECPIGLWQKTEEIEQPKEVPSHLIKEAKDIWKNINKGVAKDHETKAKLIELYNTIYGTTYKTTTNCASCLQSVHKGIKGLIS